MSGSVVQVGSAVLSAAPAASSSAVAPVVLASGSNAFLSGLPANWELFARGPGVVARIQLAHGRVTTTAIPALSTSGPVALLAGTDRVIVRPLDNVAGYAVIDGGAVVRLTGALAGGGSAVPGPDPSHVWMEVGSGAGAVVSLVDLQGATTNVGIPIPVQAGSPSSDGAGYVLFGSIDGIFAARPGSVSRITTGPLLAVGPTRWLVEECDDQLRCGLAVIDRSTGVRRAISAAVDRYELFGGVISPDGQTAALIGVSSTGVTALHLVDLTSGDDITTAVSIDQTQGLEDGEFAWSPDSKWLFAIDNGGVSAVDRTNGQRHVIAGSEPELTQLVLRVTS